MIHAIYSGIAERLFLWLNTEYALRFPVPIGQQPVSKVLQWIDRFDGQAEEIRSSEMHDNYPFGFPAVFIEFDEVEYDGATKGMQKGLLKTRFHIVQESQADSHIGVGGKSISFEQSLNLERYVAQVNSCLQGFITTGMEMPLKRIRREFDKERNNVSIEILEYECTICEMVNDPQNGWVEIYPDLVVEPDIEVALGAGSNP